MDASTSGRRRDPRHRHALGGDVMNPSGTGRSSRTPGSRTSPAGGVHASTGGESPREWRVSARSRTRRRSRRTRRGGRQGAIDAMAAEGGKLGGLRGAYSDGLGSRLRRCGTSLMENPEGPGGPYERCVIARPEAPRAVATEESASARGGASGNAGFPSRTRDELLGAVDAWRRERLVPKKSIAAWPNASCAVRRGDVTAMAPAPARGTCAGCRAPT